MSIGFNDWEEYERPGPDEGYYEIKKVKIILLPFIKVKIYKEKVYCFSKPKRYRLILMVHERKRK